MKLGLTESLGSHSISRRRFLTAMGAAAAAAALLPAGRLAAQTPSEGRSPNVVFILTDDQGFGDLSLMGHPYLRTPNLDRLASQGTLFTQHYVNSPVCSPTRVAFVTGSTPARYGVNHALAPSDKMSRNNPSITVNQERANLVHGLANNAPTVMKRLRSAGYVVGHVGKNHVGDLEALGVAHLMPNQRGRFGVVYGKNKDPYGASHTSIVIADNATQFIREHRDRPFYLNVWTRVPHAPLNASPEEREAYPNLKVEPAAFEGPMRDYVSAAEDADAQGLNYFASMTGLDKQIGRILDELDAQGLAENTIVVFASDNGPEHYRIARNTEGLGSPWKFRGRKASLYEGGIRSPLIVRWPGKVSAGQVNDQTVLQSSDFYPTLMGMLGQPVTDRVEGRDMSDAWRGHALQRDEPVKFRFIGSGRSEEGDAPELALRDGPWKFLMNRDGSRQELYDLVQDIDESENLTARHPERAAQYAALLQAWNAEVEAQGEAWAAAHPELAVSPGKPGSHEGSTDE